jgi:hypothetical protein
MTTEPEGCQRQLAVRRKADAARLRLRIKILLSYIIPEIPHCPYFDPVKYRYFQFKFGSISP